MLIEWPIDKLSLTDWLIDKLIGGRLTEWLIDWLIDWRTIDRINDELIYILLTFWRLTDWSKNFLNDPENDLNDLENDLNDLWYVYNGLIIGLWSKEANALPTDRLTDQPNQPMDHHSDI